MFEGKECAQECVCGSRELNEPGLKGFRTDDDHMDFHISRNRFETSTGGNTQILALAIKKHTNLKKMYQQTALDNRGGRFV